MRSGEPRRLPGEAAADVCVVRGHPGGAGEAACGGGEPPLRAERLAAQGPSARRRIPVFQNAIEHGPRFGGAALGEQVERLAQALQELTPGNG